MKRDAVVFLTEADLFNIHSAVLAQHGGGADGHFAGKVDGAVAAVRNAYDMPSLVALAAGYGHGLLLVHKRVKHVGKGFKARWVLTA